MKELMGDFIQECQNQMDSIEDILFSLLNKPEKQEVEEAINVIFYTFHTLKGGASILKLENLQRITLTAENLMRVFRSDSNLWSVDHIEIFTQTVGQIRKLIELLEVEEDDKKFESDTDDLVQFLDYRRVEIEESFSLEINLKKFDQDEAPTASLIDVLDRVGNILSLLVEHPDSLDDGFPSAALDQEQNPKIQKLNPSYLRLLSDVLKHHRELEKKRLTILQSKSRLQ